MRSLSCIMLLIIFSFPAWAGSSPEEIMRKVFENYNAVSSEVEYSQVVTSDWGSSPRYCTSWVRRNSGGENELMFVINRSDDLRSKSDGAIIRSKNGDIIPPVIFQKRRNIREKSSGFDEKSNGTELNYFDLARMSGEYIKNLSLSFCESQLAPRVPGEAAYFIKAVSKSAQAGDYAYRVFHIGDINGVLVVLAVEYYDSSGQMSKRQYNSSFENLEYKGKLIVRERSRWVLAGKDETTIKVTCRIINDGFGALDKDALERGQP